MLTNGEPPQVVDKPDRPAAAAASHFDANGISATRYYGQLQLQSQIVMRMLPASGYHRK
jgi:hypothetical protein